MVFLFIVIFSSLTLSIKSIFFFQRKLAEEQGKKQEERENERNRMHSSLSFLFLSFLFFSLSFLSQKNLIYVRISRENFSFCEHENLVWLLNEPELVFSNYSYHGWSTPAATLKTVNIKRLQNTVSCLRSSIWPIRRPESRIDAIATELKGGAWERPHILRTFSSKYSVLHLNQNGITSWMR